MNNSYDIGELNSMMADAIKRARAMQKRGRFNNQNNAPNREFSKPNEKKQEQQNKKQEEKEENKDKNNKDAPFDLSSFLNFSKMLGIDNDRLIIFMLIMLLSSQKDSFYTVLALLYIAL